MSLLAPLQPLGWREDLHWYLVTLFVQKTVREDCKSSLTTRAAKELYFNKDGSATKKLQAGVQMQVIAAASNPIQITKGESYCQLSNFHLHKLLTYSKIPTLITCKVQEAYLVQRFLGTVMDMILLHWTCQPMRLFQGSPCRNLHRLSALQATEGWIGIDCYFGNGLRFYLVVFERAASTWLFFFIFSTNMESLAQLEAVCERLYNSQDTAERVHAESTLQWFLMNTQYISQCQYILDNAMSTYALVLASSSLLKQVSKHKPSLQLHLDIWNYVIGYLATRGPELQPYVSGSLIQLLCRITKIGWNDDDRFREIVTDSMSFLQQSTTDHFFIGLKILNQLVAEMNQPITGLPLTYHRKIACSFRDLALLRIFQIATNSLQQLKDDFNNTKLKDQALSLALKCLSFDFVGTSPDESSEDIGTVQIPSAWRSFLEDTSILQLFFDYYTISKPPLSKEALECLVRLASVRKSLFSNETERSKYLAHLITGTKEILQTGQGLADHNNYHEFCRLLGRFKLNYQLSELVTVEGYRDWIRLVAEFTLKSLQSWQWASSSVYYLLGLWTRLVTSVPYLKSDMPSLLEEFVPKITEGFITSRFDCVQAISEDASEDPLDNIEVLQDQLDNFPYICRFQYENSSIFILKLLEPILQSYTDAASLPSGGKNSDLQVIEEQLSVIEGQLAWIVHIIASVIKIRQSTNSCSEAHEMFDAELSARVFQLLKIVDSGSHVQRYSQISKQRLDRAILTFFQQFRKSYVGDQAMNSSKNVYTRLSELIGLQDHLMVLNVIVGKIATNLKCYPQSEDVIEHTLALFHELASGYMTSKLLLKLDAIKYIIGNHTSEQFPFLDEYKCSRSRTTFYYTIGMLIFMEDSPVKFRAFMEPLHQVFISLESAPDAAFCSDAVKYALVGLMRDLRGITMAASSKKPYSLLFDWLYPNHMPVLLKALAHWAGAPEVTTPLLKFMAEFALNKNQRATFDSSSPNGILLFREISKVLVAYGTRILSLPTHADIYTFKYKGIWICLTMLTRALSGNYVNFGVFELYGDRAFADALDISLKMTLSIPLADIMAYRKLSRSYFALFEVLCNNHINAIINLDTSTFAHFVGTLETGLKCLDSSISIQCAAAIDNLASFYFNNITLGEAPTLPAVLNLARHISELPTLFPEILKTLFEIILFEDCQNQWSFSRPMLSLILVNEQLFNDMKAQILATQPLDQQPRLSQSFDKLMADVTRSLDSKNRDKFTQNLTIFKHEFRVK